MSSMWAKSWLCVLGTFGAWCTPGPATAVNVAPSSAQQTWISIDAASLAETGYLFDIHVNDLDGANGFTVRGSAAAGGEHLGTSVSYGGDLNGDGRPDLVTASVWGGSDLSGKGYALFQPLDGFPSLVEISSPGQVSVLNIEHLNTPGLGSIRTSGGRDINGDGLADLVFSSRFTNWDTMGPRAGRVSVVYGAQSSTNVDAATLDGSLGFYVDGGTCGESCPVEGDGFGRALSALADINDDGFDDLIAGAWRTDVGIGKAWIVLGSDEAFPSPLPRIELDGSRGFDIIHSQQHLPHISWHLGISAAAAGDVNGDGIADFVVGANGANLSDDTEAGNAFVVYGRANFGSQLDLNDLDGENGFRIDGENLLDSLGSSVSSAGDINGDGNSDVIVGSIGADPDGIPQAGTAYVVFGASGPRAPSVSVTDLNGENGFALDGFAQNQGIGETVASAGDWNGDGFDDIAIVGQFFTDEVYVVFGQPSGYPARVSLSNLNGMSGFRLIGLPSVPVFGGFFVPSQIGATISHGDLDGDGLSDLIVGADQASWNGADNYPGEAYVLYGQPIAQHECGNGLLNPAEDCDDSNLIDGDGCDSNCRFTGCGNSVVSENEQCDDGNTNNGDCCSSSCHFESLATVCRSSAGVCDMAETCTGSSGACPPDVKSTAVCRSSSGVCDPSEFCDGSSNTCPANAHSACEVMCGDANADGGITSADALLALRTAVGSGNCPPSRCDYNGSNSINSSDALVILRFAVGLEVGPPNCPSGAEMFSTRSVRMVPKLVRTGASATCQAIEIDA